MSDTITDRKSAVALVKYERDRSKVVYADYIAANGVMLETVSDHVKALQELAFPGFESKTAEDDVKYARKQFGNRIRNGLNFTLGKHLQPKEEAPAAEESAEEAEEAEEAPEGAVTVSDAVQGLEAALVAARDAGVDRDAVMFWVREVYGAALQVVA